MAEFLIACLELLEAEGRSLRLNAGRLGLSLGLLAAGLALGMAGVAFLLGSLYFAVASAVNRPTAFLLCGVAAVLLSGGVLWFGRRLNR